MAVSDVERVMSRRQLAAMIQADPTDIVLKRREKIPTTGGGWKYGPEQDLDKQRVTIVPFKRRMSDFIVNTELGQVVNGVYVIVGFPDLDIQRDDLWEHEGERFKVKQIDLKKEIRISAIVDYEGGTSNG